MIVVHKYISARQRESRVVKGKSPKLAAVERSLAHVKYIQHRPGEDREKGGREMFNETEEKLDPKALRKAIRELGNSKVVVHKITLAPEISPGDKRAFTREVMDQLAREKGLDLKWVAVEHNNTDHHHIHVVVLGEDKQGKEVRIDKRDYPKMKEWGDRYLERCHPLEMERAREERERKERERMEARKKERQAEREQRIRDGLELPFMHKKIMREMYEPYEQWKKLQAEKEHGKEMQAGAESDKPYFQDTIEAAGKQWSKQNTLAELTELNQYLWDNYEERLEKADYCKLVAWMHEKEELGEQPNQEPKKEEKHWDTIEAAGKKWTKKNTLAELQDLDKYLWENSEERIEKPEYKKLKAWMHEKEEFGEPELEPVSKEPGKGGQAEKTDKQETKDRKKEEKDYFEHKGQRYSKDTEYEKLTGLAQSLRENKKERLPIAHYQQLRGWIENADRARWAGVVDKQLALARTQEWQSKARAGDPNNFRYTDPVQQELMKNPVVGLYLQGASVAAQLVKWIPLDDRNRDYNKEAREELEQLKQNTHKEYVQPGRKPEDKDKAEDTIKKLDKAIEENKEAKDIAEEEKKNKQKKRDPFKFDPWGQY